MAYEFKSYRSVYRDPQSVKIAETLRNRYVDNYGAEAGLTKSLEDMLAAAEFDGDVEKVNALKEKLSASSDGRSSRGDFENLGMAINKDVQDFYKNYKPIKENYDARRIDKENKQKLVQAGSITNETYEKWVKRSTLRENKETGMLDGYTGIQYGEDGILDRNSMYTAQSIAHNVNVDEEIQKALQALQPERSGTVVKTRIEGGPGNSEWVVQRGGRIVERISEERVREITENVLGRGNVQAFMNQDADFNTFEMREDELDKVIGTRIARLESDLNRASAPDQAKIMTTIKNLKDTLAAGDVGEKRHAAKDSTYGQQYDDFMGSAISTRATTSVWGGVDSVTRTSLYERQLEAQLAASSTAAAPFVSNPSLGGITNGIRSAFVGANGTVSNESVDEYVTTLQSNQTATTTALVELLPNLMSIFGSHTTSNTDSYGNVTDTAEIGETLQAMSYQEIKEFVEAKKNEKYLTDGNGGKITADAAYGHIIAAKQAHEEFESASRYAELLINDAAIVTGYTPEGINIASEEAVEGFRNSILNGGTVEPENAQKFVNTLIRDLYDGEEFISPDHSEYGDIEELLLPTLANLTGDEDAASEMLNQALQTARQVQDGSGVWEDFGGIGTHIPNTPTMMDDPRAMSTVSPPDATLAAATKVLDNITDAHTKMDAVINESSQGEVAFPIFNEAPMDVSGKTTKKFEEAVKALGVMALLGYVPSKERVAGESTTDPLTIGDKLSNIEGGDVMGVTYSKIYDRSGNVIDTVLLNIKWSNGSPGSQNTTVSILARDLMANVIVEETGLPFSSVFLTNSLGARIINRAYRSVNMIPSRVLKEGSITIPYEGFGHDLKITFQASSKGKGIEIGKGNVKIIGTAPNGTIINIASATFEEYMKMMSDLGVRGGRPQEVQNAGLDFTNLPRWEN